MKGSNSIPDFRVKGTRVKAMDERSIGTDNESVHELEKDFEEAIGVEVSHKIHSMNQRRKTERVVALCQAAHRGELDKITRLLDTGLNVNETDVNGRTALHVAASEGRASIVSYLLERGANPKAIDKEKNTPLNDSVREKQDVVSSLLKNYDRTLHVVLPGAAAAVRMCQYASVGDTEQLNRLLDNGVPVDSADYDSRCALHLASCSGNETLVRSLLEKKADVNCKDRFKGTPLMDAVRHGHQNVQKILREAGGHLSGIEIAEDVCQAASVGDVDRIHTLILNGADPSIADYDNRTALHLAASNGQVRVLDYLIGRCNANPLDRHGGTPLEDAYRHGKSVSIAMLTQAGGLRADDPALSDLGRLQEIERNSHAKLQRAAQIEGIVSGCPEAKAFVWVRGRCGKLLPSKIQKLAESCQNLVVLVQLCAGIQLKSDGSERGSSSVLASARADSLVVEIDSLSLQGNKGQDDDSALADVAHLTMEDSPGSKSDNGGSMDYGRETANMDSMVLSLRSAPDSTAVHKDNSYVEQLMGE